MRSRDPIFMALLGLLLAAAIPSDGFGQARTLKKITPKPPAETREAAPPQEEVLPRDACIESVHEIAAAWGEGTIDRVLHPDFPNRTELVDAIRRASLDASNITLSVESVPSIRYTPVEVRRGKRVTECIAEVVTRLLWEDPRSGERKRGGEGRAQWRIELEVADEGGAR